MREMQLCAQSYASDSLSISLKRMYAVIVDARWYKQNPSRADSIISTGMTSMLGARKKCQVQQIWAQLRNNVRL